MLMFVCFCDFPSCRICAVDLKFPPVPRVSEEAKDMIKQLLVKEPTKRLSLADVVNHPWITANADPTGRWS